MGVLLIHFAFGFTISYWIASVIFLISYSDINNKVIESKSITTDLSKMSDIERFLYKTGIVLFVPALWIYNKIRFNEKG